MTRLVRFATEGCGYVLKDDSQIDRLLTNQSSAPMWVEAELGITGVQVTIDLTKACVIEHHPDWS